MILEDPRTSVHASEPRKTVRGGHMISGNERGYHVYSGLSPGELRGERSDQARFQIPEGKTSRSSRSVR